MTSHSWRSGLGMVHVLRFVGWVTQQVERFHLHAKLADLPLTILMRDNDVKYPPTFDEVFCNANIEVPQDAHALAERSGGGMARRSRRTRATPEQPPWSADAGSSWLECPGRAASFLRSVGIVYTTEGEESFTEKHLSPFGVA